MHEKKKTNPYATPDSPDIPELIRKKEEKILSSDELIARMRHELSSIGGSDNHAVKNDIADAIENTLKEMQKNTTAMKKQTETLKSTVQKHKNTPHTENTADKAREAERVRRQQKSRWNQER